MRNFEEQLSCKTLLKNCCHENLHKLYFGKKQYLSIDEFAEEEKLLLQEDFSHQDCVKNYSMKQLTLIIVYLVNHILIDRSDEAKEIFSYSNFKI